MALLERAAAKRDVPTERLVQAFKVLEKAKLPVSATVHKHGGARGQVPACCLAGRELS